MAFLPHAQRWRALAVLVVWLLLLARSGAIQTGADHAELGSDQNQMEGARREIQASLNIYRSLAQKAPDTYLPYVAATLNDLGILNSDQNRTEEARREDEE